MNAHLRNSLRNSSTLPSSDVLSRGALDCYAEAAERASYTPWWPLPSDDQRNPGDPRRTLKDLGRAGHEAVHRHLMGPPHGFSRQDMQAGDLRHGRAFNRLIA